MAREIRENFGIDAVLKNGYLGSFDIYVNGENIFSFSETGRYPEDGQISEIIREKYPGYAYSTPEN